MNIRKFGLGLAVAGAMVWASSWGAPVQAASPYYKGKTIEIIAGTGAGSGTELVARAFIKVWSKYIPGNPTFVVKNLPGAGGAKALTFVYDKGKPDGTVLYFGVSNLISKALNPKRMRFELDKMSIIGLGGQEHMALVNKDVGITDATQLVKLKQIVTGGARADDPLSLEARLSLSMLGVNFRHVHGYRGMPKIAKAAATGEIQFFTTATLGYRVVSKNFVADGSLIPMYYHPYFDGKGQQIRSEEFKEMPSFIDVYRKVHGKDPSGPLFETYKWMLDVNGHPTGFIAPPKVDPKLVAILRDTHAKTAADPAVKKGRLASVFNWKPQSDLDRSLAAYKATSPEILATLKEIATKE